MILPFYWVNNVYSVAYRPVKITRIIYYYKVFKVKQLMSPWDFARLHQTNNIFWHVEVAQANTTVQSRCSFLVSDTSDGPIFICHSKTLEPKTDQTHAISFHFKILYTHSFSLFSHAKSKSPKSGKLDRSQMSNHAGSTHELTIWCVLDSRCALQDPVRSNWSLYVWY